MFRYPYMLGPDSPASPPAQEPPNPLSKNTAFSPELSLLLGMVLKDGFCRQTVFDMLQGIYPYVEPSDRGMIEKICGIREFTQGYRPDFQCVGGKALTRQERELNLLRILRQYASQDTVRIFNRLEQSIQMQSSLSRMMHRIQNLQSAKISNPDDLLDMMEDFVSPSERGQMRNITQMMHLFKNMNGLKPEDLLKMWGGMRK